MSSQSGHPVDRRFLIGALGGAAGVAALSRLAQAGPLNPPAGPIAPTGKTVQEIYDKVARTDVGFAEPRIPVQSLPGSATALHVISQPGSYYLTGNIEGVPGKRGIEIAADGVTVDCSGHELRGVAGALEAIAASSPVEGVCVVNGAVRNWPEVAFDFGGSNGGLFERLRFLLNGGSLRSGQSAVVRDCVFRANRCFALDSGANCLIASCTVSGNQVCGGFLIFNRSLVVNCTATQNAFEGFRIDFESQIRDCISTQNGTGFALGSGVVAVGCMSRGNNTGYAVGNGSMATECVDIDSPVGFNATGSNALITRCAKRGGGSGFDIAPNNSHGPIVNVAGVGDISAVPNANHPWANFIY